VEIIPWTKNTNYSVQLHFLRNSIWNVLHKLIKCSLTQSQYMMSHFEVRSYSEQIEDQWWSIRKPIRNSVLLIALGCNQNRRILLCTCSSASPPAPNSQTAVLMGDTTASTEWDTRTVIGWCSFIATAWGVGPVWGTGTGTVLLMVTAMGIGCGMSSRAGRTVQWQDMEQGQQHEVC
jgi:hypothetical protein